jgi:MYXO-CTERM domain-containing protein
MSGSASASGSGASASASGATVTASAGGQDTGDTDGGGASGGTTLDDGCSCSTDAPAKDRGWLGSLMLLGLGGLIRRRRR